ncbi:hypothetical protein FA13DRAFT_1798541 [Coprinellus micaceus]|uniref:RecQ-mediated genome instability protein 1 n=1 Tax=Coprinellus micaceus TaxID=71717 RepID=A0A4Y7SLR5_COPMI|nr:hypothetical protein FA13DRAFT_1798541 [Coprinellus micaceus]
MNISNMTAKVIRHFQSIYTCPMVSWEWTSKRIEDIMEETNMPYFDYDHIVPRIHEEILNVSLKDIATPETGLTPFINSPTAYGTIEGPLVLEIVHITEIGLRRRISAIRPATRERKSQPIQQSVQALPDYTRERLKLVLSDGFIELEAIECGRLPDIVLGETPMGTKIRLENLPIIAGVGHLRPECVEMLGGAVPDLELEHSVRLFKELEIRVEQELDRALALKVSPQRLYNIYSCLSPCSAYRTNPMSFYQRFLLSLSDLTNIVNACTDNHVSRDHISALLEELGIESHPDPSSMGTGLGIVSHVAPTPSTVKGKAKQSRSASLSLPP